MAPCPGGGSFAWAAGRPACRTALARGEWRARASLFSRARADDCTAQLWMTGPRAAPGAAAACTRTALTRSTLVTAGQGTAWPRSGFSTQMPLSSATIRGHQAHPYTTPVTATTRNAVTTEEWPRPLAARATRLATANTSHAHHSTTAPALRNTCRSLTSPTVGPAEHGLPCRQPVRCARPAVEAPGPGQIPLGRVPWILVDAGGDPGGDPARRRRNRSRSYRRRRQR